MTQPLCSVFTREIDWSCVFSRCCHCDHSLFRGWLAFRLLSIEQMYELATIPKPLLLQQSERTVSRIFPYRWMWQTGNLLKLYIMRIFNRQTLDHISNLLSDMKWGWALSIKKCSGIRLDWLHTWLIMVGHYSIAFRLITSTSHSVVKLLVREV